MAVLVRQLTSPRASVWAAAEDNQLWANGQFPFQLLHDLYDSRGGLSFFEVTSRDDPALIGVAAALHFPAGNDKILSKDRVESVHFRTVHSADVQALGLTITATPGETRDSEVNKLHREITGINGPLAVELARLMAQNPTVDFKAAEVAGGISDGICKGYLHEKFLHGNMIHNLIREGAATITYKAA